MKPPILAAVLACGAALVMIGGCRGAADPSILRVPNVGPPPTELGALLASFAPGQRLSWADLVAACREDSTCLESLAAFEAELRVRCPAATCTDPVARMIHLGLSDPQRSSGLYPPTLPRADAVLEGWKALRDSAGAGQPASPAR